MTRNQTGTGAGTVTRARTGTISDKLSEPESSTNFLVKQPCKKQKKFGSKKVPHLKFLLINYLAELVETFISISRVNSGKNTKNGLSKYY
jgi:hypothetical protein